MQFEKEIEPLLKENPSKYTVHPIEHPDLWNAYRTHVNSKWTVDDVREKISRDIKDWPKLDADEQHFIKTILAFFAASDGIVSENITENFAEEVQLTEAKAFYAFQNWIEFVHSETYSLLIETYINDPIEKHQLLNAIHEIDCVKKKAEWAQQWMKTGTQLGNLPLEVQKEIMRLSPQSDVLQRFCNEPQKSFAQRQVAFICVEGIFFAGSFCAIFWIKKKGIMHGLTLSNEWISRDESLHYNFGILLYRDHIHNKLTEKEVHQIFREAVNIEKEFILEALPCRLIGMNGTAMSNYIEFVADRLLILLGYSKIYYSENPFTFMPLQGLEGKTNFFERDVSEYSQGHTDNAEENVVRFDCDF